MTREEAKKILSERYNSALFSERKALETLIPELTESEGEKIRKAIVTLIEDLQHYSTNYAGVDPTDMLAWLEKQKEQKPVEDWREKRKEECPFRRNLDNNLYGCERYADVVCACDGNCSWVVDYPKLKEIQDKKEQKPTGWSEEDEDALNMCLDAIPKKWKTKSGILLTKWLKDNIHLQSKQEWSEEDRDRVVQYLHDRDGGMLWSKATEITNDILDILRPQPRKEI